MVNKKQFHRFGNPRFSGFPVHEYVICNGMVLGTILSNYIGEILCGLFSIKVSMLEIHVLYIYHALERVIP